MQFTRADEIQPLQVQSRDPTQGAGGQEGYEALRRDRRAEARTQRGITYFRIRKEVPNKEYERFEVEPTFEVIRKKLSYTATEDGVKIRQPEGLTFIATIPREASDLDKPIEYSFHLDLTKLPILLDGEVPERSIAKRVSGRKEFYHREAKSLVKESKATDGVWFSPDGPVHPYILKQEVKEAIGDAIFERREDIRDGLEDSLRKERIKVRPNIQKVNKLVHKLGRRLITEAIMTLTKLETDIIRAQEQADGESQRLEELGESRGNVGMTTILTELSEPLDEVEKARKGGRRKRVPPSVGKTGRVSGI